MVDLIKKWPLFLAVFLIVSALILRLFISPYLLRLPPDFSYSAELSSIDNFYDEDLRSYIGAQYSSSEFNYEVTSYKELGYLIRNFFRVQNMDGDVIISLEREYGIDPITKTHVATLGDRVREGYLFAPSHLEEGESFYYWHVNYDAPALMSYVESTHLEGLLVFHYETYYPDQWVDQTASLDALPGVPEQRGVVVEPHLELWVEPLTGYLVSYKDQSTAYYYDQSTLERNSPWNQFSNTFTEESIQAHVLDAKILRTKSLFCERYLPLLFFGVGLFLLLYFFWHRKHLENGNDRVHWMIPLLILVVPLSGLGSTWILLRASMMREVNLLFDQQVEKIEDAILKRIEIYANSMEGVTGLFVASEGVSRSEWASYVRELELSEDYPGVLGVGYVVLIPPEEKSAHIAEVRAEGFPNYTITPEGDRSLYSSILYIEPFEGENLLTFGYDILSEDRRKEAIDLARDSGAITLSGKIHLIQDVGSPGEAGFMMVLPLYTNGMPHDTLAERRQTISGFVYSPFRTSQLIDGIFPNLQLGVHFDIYDGLNVDPGELMFSYDAQNKYEHEHVVFFERVDTIFLLGHPWTIEFQGTEAYSLNSEQKMILYGVLIVGSTVSLLFIFLFFALLVSRQRLVRYIQKKKRFISL